LLGQTRANKHNAWDYANKHSGFAFRFAPVIRIICTMQNDTCFAGAHPVDLIGHSTHIILSKRSTGNLALPKINDLGFKNAFDLDHIAESSKFHYLPCQQAGDAVSN
jgi:hypothetical protein